jgi:signal recognition particle subunit SRP54
MTPAERQNPDVIDTSRRRRIARGSGTTTQEVNGLLKQFKEMQKMMKMLTGGGGGPKGGAGGKGMGKGKMRMIRNMRGMMK